METEGNICYHELKQFTSCEGVNKLSLFPSGHLAGKGSQGWSLPVS